MELGALFANANHRKQPRNTKSRKQDSKGKGAASDTWKKDATCHFCGKKGHIKPDCFSYKKQQGTASGGKTPGRNNNLAA